MIKDSIYPNILFPFKNVTNKVFDTDYVLEIIVD
jgi:hypothetical protein